MAALTPVQLGALRQQILAQASELEQLLVGQHAKAKPVQLDQQAVGRVSRIDAIQQQEMAKAGEVHSAKHLQALHGALKRLDSGDYGFCEECGETIALARLKIKPEALFCINCQDSHD